MQNFKSILFYFFQKDNFVINLRLIREMKLIEKENKHFSACGGWQTTLAFGWGVGHHKVNLISHFFQTKLLKRK